MQGLRSYVANVMESCISARICFRLRNFDSYMFGRKQEFDSRN